MKDNWIRFNITLIAQVRKIFEKFKYYLLGFFILFLISFITGVMTCSNYSSIVTCDNLINKYLLDYLMKENTYITFFLALSFFFLCINLFVIFATRNIFIVILDSVVLLFISYILGFDCCILIISLGISGIIFGSIVYGLLCIFALFSLIFVMAISINRYKEKKKNCEIFDNSKYIKLYIFFITLGELLLLLMSILFGIIHIFVIVD